MQRLFLIIVLLTFINPRIYLKSHGYDSTYVLAIKQKFAIPEYVVSGDHVGTWNKTFTWRSGNSVKFFIKDNFKSAFAIDQFTGLITVLNANLINGKIFQQDTVINIIIRTIDSGIGFEDDTCEIRVKENKFCKFINYDYHENGTGDRKNPYNDFSDVTVRAGYAYFIKRGNKIFNKRYDIPGFQANSRHPTIIAAYSSGNNPVFEGAGLNSGSEAFDFMNQPSPSKYCYIFNIDVSNYPSMAFRVRTRSSNFGFYNCRFNKNVFKDYNAGLADIYFFGNASDTLIRWGHELINVESAGSWGPILKSDASGVKAVNIKSATASKLENKGYNFRLAISYYSSLSHFWFIGGDRSLQVRYPYVKIIDGIITGSAGGGIFLVTNNAYNGKPDHLQVSNVLFRNNENGIFSYNSNINNLIIENCLFDSNSGDGVHFRNGGIDRIIRFCSFINNKDDGLEFAKSSTQTTKVLVEKNLFVGNKGKSINASISGCANFLKIYNNTIIGVVDLSGSSNAIIKNNLYSFIIGKGSFFNNIILNSDSVSEYFIDPQTYDYRLTPTAILRFKKRQQIENQDRSVKNKIYSIGAFDIGDD